MVGNSLRSDVLPVTTVGGQAVHIPYALTWAHENVTLTEDARESYHELEHLGLLPALIETLSSGS
jgi:putative hydrolase of the HAD superfamily